MIEPKIRSAITKWLPTEHWMNGVTDGDEWACRRCSYVIYRRPPTDSAPSDEHGTVITWIEHGLIDGTDTPTSYPLCILCFRSYASTTPEMHSWWFLNDDGTPQDPRDEGWMDELLVEQPYTGVDMNDPPMELNGFQRIDT